MEMMGGSIEEYKKRLNKSLKQPKKGTGTANKSGGKSPARLAAEKKKAKLMSEVGTNKTNTKSVLGVTDFAKKPKKTVGNKDMKGGNRGPKTIPAKNTLKMSKIASDAKKSAKMDATEKSTRGLKAPAKKTKKAPIVTKEQLEKSGLSLRDYMNMMQGKTRRDKKGPEMSDKAFEARRNNPKKMMAGGKVKKMMGGGMTKIKYRGGGIVKQGVRPTRYI